MDLESHVFQNSLKGWKRDIRRGFGLLSSSGKHVHSLKPAGELELIQTKILVVAGAYPFLQLLKFEELLLEKPKFELTHLSLVVEIDIALVNQVGVALTQILEEVSEFEKEENLTSVQFLIQVRIVDLENVLAGIIRIFHSLDKLSVLFLLETAHFFKEVLLTLLVGFSRHGFFLF